MTQRRYKTRPLRQLLITAYDLEELRTLCYDEFRPVYEEYSEVGKRELVRRLIEYCDRKGLFDQLLRFVEEDVPEKYAAYAGRLWTETPVSPPVSAPAQRTSTPAPPSPPAPAPRLSTPAPDILTIAKPFVVEFVRVPAGEFLMGSDPLKDKNARDDEQPQHSLNLPEFYIGKYPVTNAQYAAFLRAAGHKVGGPWQSGQFPAGGTTHPAIYVAWRDVVAFCRWFSQTGDYLVRLPTEAEWEKAARGTDGRIYPWGDQPPTAELCNFGNNEGGPTCVGKYSPQGDSPYGAADMAGNVWEWVSTIWVEKAYPFFYDLRTLEIGAVLNPGFSNKLLTFSPEFRPKRAYYTEIRMKPELSATNLVFSRSS